MGGGGLEGSTGESDYRIENAGKTEGVTKGRCSLEIALALRGAEASPRGITSVQNSNGPCLLGAGLGPPPTVRRAIGFPSLSQESDLRAACITSALQVPTRDPHVPAVTGKWKDGPMPFLGA